MGYGELGSVVRVRREPLEFCERGWQRKPLAEWDDRWQRLSVPARQAFLRT